MREELRKRERWLQIAESTASAGLLEWDLASGAAHWTRGLAAIFGMPEVAAGHETGTISDILERIHPEDRGHVESTYGAAASIGDVQTVDFRVVRPDGELRWLSSSGEVFRRSDDPPDCPGRLIAVLTEVTALTWMAEQEHAARVRAAREARRVAALQAATAALSEAHDPDQLAHALLGRAPAALGGSGGVLFVNAGDTGWLSMMHATDIPAAMERKWQRLSLEDAAHSPTATVARTRRPLFFSARDEFVARFPGLAADYDESSAHALAFLPLSVRYELLGVLLLRFPIERPFDLEDQATLCTLAGLGAQALLRVRLHEAERLARAEAERARQEAELANAAKSRFLAVMSHELRTPLNSVIGYADLLLMQTRGALTEVQQAQVQRIRLAARQQLELVESILTFSRIEAGREDLRLTTLDLADLLREVADTLRPAAEGKGLALELGPATGNLVIVSDPGKLRQVLLNLVGNAVKYTNEGRVDLSADVTRDDQVRVTVRDTGIGIDPASLDQVWQPFTQLDQSNTRQVGGTGLGLTIARRLASLLGAAIDVESAPGRGSRFSVRLPRRPPDPQPS